MRSPIPDLVKKSRQDVSGYLWHFCREDICPEKAILTILDEKRIHASQDRDTSKKVVCFTEAPLEQIRRQAPALRESKFPRFSLYGIGFKKDFIFRKGGLPVIYQPRNERDALPDCMRWRHVDLDLNIGRGIDYSWMREWRINADLHFACHEDEVIVVAPDIGDFEGVVFRTEEDGDVGDGQLQRFIHVDVFWNFISLESMESPIDDSAIDVATRQRGSFTLYT